MKPSDNVVSFDSSAAMLRVLSGCLRGESFPMMGARPYDGIRLGLFSHGVESVGVAPIERRRAVLSRARERGEFVGEVGERYQVRWSRASLREDEHGRIGSEPR